MTGTLSTELTRENIARVLELLAAAPAALERLSAPCSPQQLLEPLGEGERSLTETLAHLIHSEARASEAIYLALLMEEPLLPGIHSEREWGRLLRYDLQPFSDLLAYFRLRRAVLLRVLASLTEIRWSRLTREEGKKRKESVYWRARALALHEREHLDDLDQKLNGSRR